MWDVLQYLPYAGENGTIKIDINAWVAYMSHDFELMQFTWLLDKNGKEIWEWDVALIFWITAEVKYSDIWCWWVFFCSQKPKELQELPFYDWTKWNYTECEIIGNVYENPEIL